MMQLTFYGFAILTLAGAVAVLVTKNVMYAAFFLLLTLLGVAGLFVLTSADFLAVAQIMIYVGGVLVLVIFGVMLTHKPTLKTGADSQHATRVPSLNRISNSWVVTLLVAGGLFVALYSLLVRSSFVLFQQPIGWGSTVRRVGIQLMTAYLVPFEIISILLLAALVGATHLAGKKSH